MANKPQLLDRYGNPVRRAVLTAEVAAPTVGGVRSPMAGYPADGLTPVRLASILRSADAGDPVRYLELAETIEERDLHYLGVLGTRRRAVSQLDISVEAASDAAEDVDRADMVREWLTRGELAEELFDILDAIGKGYSFTEIIWDRSEDQWRPERLEYRDPRWFRFDRVALATPMMIGDDGTEQPLDPFKFITATIKAKSGLALRSGLARAAAWAWMFKAFTQRDWAIFSQTYGQPLRVGKYGPGASEDDKEKLFQAVANIAGDCAAIVPESMAIEFIEAGNLSATGELYRERSDWLDRQVSKAVLGQTATTDAVTGGLGSGKEHRQVQEDIERADARQLAAILNRDLIRPWMQLEFGPLRAYPMLKIGRPEQEDLKAFADAIGPMIDRGLRISQAAVRDKFGLAEPGVEEELMMPSPRPNPAPEPGLAPPDAAGADDTGRIPSIKRDSAPIKRQVAVPGPETHLNAENASTAKKSGGSVSDLLADRMEEEAAPAIEALLAKIEAMAAAATSLEELREMILAGFPEIDTPQIGQVIAMGMLAAHAGGRVVAEEDGDGT